MTSAPRSRRPDTRLIQSLHRKRYAVAGAGILKLNPLRMDVQQKAGFHLPGVIARIIFEDLVHLLYAQLIKVDNDDEDADLRLHIADDRLELVPAVGVEDDQAVDSLFFQRLRYIAHDGQGRGGFDADRRDLVELLGVVAEGNRWKNDRLGPRLECKLGRALRQRRGFDYVGAVRQVVVVGFGRAPGENRDVRAIGLELAIIGLEQDVRTCRHRS